MILGIVGHEAAKFTPNSESRARDQIKLLLLRVIDLGIPEEVTRVVSGACHLGGIDLWAIEEAKKLSIDTQDFPPRTHSWEYGYKPRNMQIAENSDAVVCLVVKELPPSYTGMRFKQCYHCLTDTHVKSGGCWTVKYARSLGKAGLIVEI